MDEGRPIFRQLAEQIENQIIDGSLVEGQQVPSTNEFAAFHRINPATALKGITLLVDAGVLFKRRGIGMFVADGARERLLAERRERFAAEFVQPLLLEARGLQLSTDHIIDIIRKESAS
ncbi:MAG: GntR family transcriptional regulator [Microcella sp.]|uniref:GntR family transcriptional regulator n=1 Tax=Microcella sp. TaxID=1913979 RepID=UPI0024CB6FE4|nr:GntR family transcriptional regulator [Microcella sp.]UYN84709.1 MAG: GntR family transcriptional regulator [Microcella sp.]